MRPHHPSVLLLLAGCAQISELLPETREQARARQDAVQREQIAESMRRNEQALAEYDRQQKEAAEKDLERIHGPEWAAARKEVSVPLECPHGSAPVRSHRLEVLGRTARSVDSEACTRKSDGVRHGPAREWDSAYDITDLEYRDGKLVEDSPELVSEGERVALPAGMFVGWGSHQEREKVEGVQCDFSGERQLTLKVEANGDVMWEGYSVDGARCRDNSSLGETRCRQSGVGFIEKVGTKLVFRSKVTSATGIWTPDTSQALWKCGLLKVTVASDVELGRPCVRLGLAEDNSGDETTAQLLCQANSPWKDLSGAVVTFQRDRVRIPWWGKRARLDLKRVAPRERR